MQTYVKGTFKRFIYKGENGYVIGLFKVKETNSNLVEKMENRTLTFTGYFHELTEDDNYTLYGNLINHPKYGFQYQVENYEHLLPEEKDSMVEFLCGGLFKGIGEKTAEKIVAQLGKDTFKVILENPSNLFLIPGLTKKQIDTLHNTLVEYEASYQVIIHLGELGFNTRDSLMIYYKYKASTEDVISTNIYLIIEDVLDIGYKKIDAIALKNGMKRDDTRRIQAAILYVIDEACNLYGHSYLHEDEIYAYTIRALNNRIADSEFSDSLIALEKDIKIIKEDEKYYLTRMYEAELNIAKRCGYLMRLSDNTSKKLDSIIKDVEEFFGCFYNDKQREAITSSFTKNFLIITGGPGTGKTTIIRAICELYRKINDLSKDKLTSEIALLAPTGRASKRISEFTNLPASTIHRFLKWNKDNNKFGINEYHKSEAKFVIIDEFSMVDTYLFDSLLKGLRYDTKIILVGDDNQLPSVGPGQLLKDMIESNLVNVVKLKELYRQKENSNIISLAYQINEDKLDTTIFNKDEDLTFIPTPADGLMDKILEIASINKNSDMQILAPMYKTINGIDLINVNLQKVSNPKDKNKKELLINDVTFRENDKVIQLTNMPDDNVFNGDIGYINEIQNGSRKEVYIDFDLNIVKYSPASFQKFKHAYAISIHKSQGSEFDTVIIPITNGYGKMLYRKLIYTAVTRAKKKLYLIGEISALEKAIKNDDVHLRRTTLKDAIIKNIS